MFVQYHSVLVYLASGIFYDIPYKVLFFFFQFIYKIFTEALVKDKGYDSSLLEDNFEDLKDFWYE